MNENLEACLYAFMEYIQIERNYSEYTVKFYRQDIEHFYLFMNEQGITELGNVEYFDARLYLTTLFEKEYSILAWLGKFQVCEAFINF